MPYLYVYSPSDFIIGPPDEAGSDADGSGTFTLQLAPGATGTRIEITDEDLVFSEIDATQSLTNTINLDGTTYTAGTTINSAYDLINTTTDHKVTSFHFGGDGYQQGPVDGIASSIQLEPGVTYTFDSERTSYQNNNLYSDFVACFTAETAIRTREGPVKAKDLKPGDLIETMDHGFQPLRMVLSRRLSADDLTRSPNMRPVLILAGALGEGLPVKDLMVSPQHRFLVQSPIAKRMFGEEETLIAATKMTSLPGVYVEDDCTGVEYYHLVMDRHEVIYAEGAPTESYYFGPLALEVLPSETRRELEELFPELTEPDFSPRGARFIPSNKQQVRLMQRHKKNGKPLVLSGRGAVFQ